jgi:D-glycero-D-manno-heptose 1,7-bisphosphate phosphatase
LERPGKGWCARFASARFTPHATDALFRCTRAGWLLYLVGNETQVALGRQSVESWQAFEQALEAHLASLGVPVARSYACLDDPGKGVRGHRRDSVFRLPNTGAMYHAAQHDGVDLARSWVIGGGSLELTAGWRAGCALASLAHGQDQPDGGVDAHAAIEAGCLADALDEIRACAPSRP